MRARPRGGAAASAFGGRSLVRRLLLRLLRETAGAVGGAAAPPARQVERVDVTQFFSDATRELLQRAAQTALEWGSLDLDSDHLLYAALQDDVVRHVLEQIDADPEAIAAQVEEEAEQAERTDVAPSLSPDAKAALLAAYEESRELGASYVGPEHVLLALARDDEAEAGRLLQRFGVSHTKLRGAVIRGVERRRAARDVPTPTLDEFGRDLTAAGARGQARPGDRAGRRDRADDRDPLAPDEEQPGADRRARRRQDRDRRGHRAADRQRRGARDAGGQARRRARPRRA